MTHSDGWNCRAFSTLSGREVFDILRLRCEVFIVEQNCPYPDPDDLDLVAWHWQFRVDGQLRACQRSLPPGAAYADCSALGRIVVAPAQRGSSTGRELVRRGIADNLRRWPGHDIKIGAQSYLERFYTALGFARCGDDYLEDGIPHLPMLYPAS
jgi:ElaA protein